MAEDIRRNQGLINSPARLNVAMTRAKGLQIVIGNPDCLQMDPLWVSFLSFYARKKCHLGCPLPLAITEAGQSYKAAPSNTENDVEGGGKREEELVLPGRLERAYEWGKQLMAVPENNCLGSNTVTFELAEENLSLNWSRDFMELMLLNEDGKASDDTED